jgi:hypothetical protein
MKTTLKTLAIASLMGTVAAPVFAQTMDATMTCAEYKALSPEDQMTVASMAIAELDDSTAGSLVEGDAKASDGVGDETTAAEATDATSDQGSVIAGEAKAVEPTGGNTMASNMTAEPMDEAAMERFMTVCDQDLDATVADAAAGLDSTR